MLKLSAHSNFMLRSCFLQHERLRSKVDVPWLSAAHHEARQAASELAASIKAGEDVTFAWPCVFSQAGFWLMLVGALLLGCSAVLVAVSCRHCRKKASQVVTC